MSNLLAQRIEETIVPIVGAVLANISIDLEAKRIGKTSDTLMRADLPTIAENLEQQLAMVVGPELAAIAAQRVRDLP